MQLCLTTTNSLRCVILLVCLPFVYTWNFKLSEWLYDLCGRHLIQFASFSLIITTVISVALYMACWVLVKFYYARFVVFKSFLKTNNLSQTPSVHALEMLSFAIAEFKEHDIHNNELLLPSESSESDFCFANKSSDDMNLCLVCYENDANMSTEPCRHRALCSRCAWKYIATCLQNKLPFTCIICRTEIKRFAGDTTVSISPTRLKELLTMVNNVSPQSHLRNGADEDFGMASFDATPLDCSI